MERLKLFLALSALVCVAPSVYAQNAVPAATQSGTFAVVGDVEQPNLYAFQPGMTLHEAVRKTRPLASQVNVAVLRSAQTRSQWTQLLNMNAADSGERVVVGDVLVVQSLQNVTVPQKNAAVQTPSGIHVIALADDQVVIGDVLTGLGLSTSGHQLSVPARLPGQAPSKTSALSDRVHHGDVICLGNVGTQTTRDFGSVRHSFSEWKSAEAVASPAASGSPAAPAALTLPMNPNSEPTTSEELPLQVSPPEVSQNAESQTSADSEPALTIPVSADPFDVQSAPVALADPFATEDESTGLEVKPVSQQVSSTPLISVPAEVAPIPPVEDLIEPQAGVNAEMSILNILVIGGLLVAGILVLVGSLRVDDEIQVSGMQQTMPLTSYSDSARPEEPVAQPVVPSKAIAGRDELEVSAERLLAAKPIEAAPVAPMVMEKAAAPVAASSLVREGEWFSRDWAPRSQLGKDGMAMTAEKAGPAFLLEKTVDEAIAAKSIDLPIQAMMQDTMAKQEPAAAIVAPKIAVPEATMSVPPATPGPSIMAMEKVEAVTNELPSDDLDDLIQNRLPIDLKEVQLPLRINLFGRPAGPRRLRIDAAHTTIRAPHMVSSADRRRNDSMSGRIGAGAAETAEDDLQFGSQNTRKERIDS